MWLEDIRDIGREHLLIFDFSALSPTAPQYQVRLFGTNEQYFNPSRSASSQSPVPIDFPSAVEITFNNCNVPPISKGVKKQVGSTPPVNLGATKTASGNSALILIPGRANRLEVHYSNTERVSSVYCPPTL